MSTTQPAGTWAGGSVYRPSQLYERRPLRIGSPLFHFRILVELLGHLGAVVLGSMAGVATLGGPAVLIYRRRTLGPVFSATPRNDKAMYVSLPLTVALGPSATVTADVVGGGYDYRETISPWFR